MARNKQFDISSFHRYSVTMALTLISVMIMPSYYVPQLAWSQSPDLAQDNAFTRAQTEHVKVGDINIAYKRFGEGKPILFIPGTSQPKEAWDPTLLSQLAATNHTVIVFDNRGMGETTVGTQPFSIEQFANDAAGLLDALQIEKADVLGASLGSFVAQELTLNYPEKVDRLILHATYCGGSEAVYPSEEVVPLLVRISTAELLQNMTVEEQTRLLAEFLFPQEWLNEHPEILNSVALFAPSRSATPEIIERQGNATAAWSAQGSCDRLSSITQPTLLIVGGQDVVLPAANSIMMAQRIPNSWLVIIEGVGHGMMLQVPTQFNAIVQTFLETTAAN
jgi:pimeloyl-ACP methyl ester carboxylesterase